jgi:3-methyladenine DNA glycosylase AlkC
MPYCIANPDTKKLLINNIIISICNFKKCCKINKPVFFIDETKLDFQELYIIKEVFSVMEIFNSEKSNAFFRKFMKYVKKNDLKYLKDIYFKQVSNKLALFK